MTTDGDMKLISFPEESKTVSNEMRVLIDYVISSLQSFSLDDINKFFHEVNAGLYNRFEAVEKSRQFRDLPQGKLRIKRRYFFYFALFKISFNFQD